MLRATVRDHLQPLALNLPGTAFPDKLFQAFNAMLHFEKNRRCAHKDQSFGFTWSIPVVWSSPCSCHSGRVLIVASLRPAVRTKKGFRTNSPRNSGARGTWNKGVFVGGKT